MSGLESFGNETARMRVSECNHPDRLGKGGMKGISFPLAS